MLSSILAHKDQKFPQQEKTINITKSILTTIVLLASNYNLLSPLMVEESQALEEFLPKVQLDKLIVTMKPQKAKKAPERKINNSINTSKIISSKNYKKTR